MAELAEEDQRVMEALVELGVDPDEARAAIEDDRVALVLATQTFDEPTDFRIEDLAEASGLSVEVLGEVFAATGHPGDGFTQGDLEVSHQVAQLLEVLPLPALLRLSRARSMALSAVARADVAMVRDNIVRPLREAGADDLAIAVALAGYVGEFDRIGRRLLVHEYRTNVRMLLRSELATLAARSDSPAVTACVGFVDLVGYTALAARVDPYGLDDLLDTFEQRVVQAAGTQPDVTVVKFLGDAAMFVSPDLTSLTDVLIRLSTAVEDGDEVPIRAGLARGAVLMREGDYFGTAVNVAARLTDLARPWSLLADDELKDDLSEHYSVRRVRPVRVRGLGTRRPLVVRPAFDLEVDAIESQPGPVSSADSADSWASDD